MRKDAFRVLARRRDGSGKTEAYFEAVAEGRLTGDAGVISSCPEIALSRRDCRASPRGSGPKPVAHKLITDMRASTGDGAEVASGTGQAWSVRPLALFLPFRNLGLRSCG